MLAVGAPRSSRPAQAGPEGKVGLLIVDHGEPPEYNQFTYWSFRGFFNHLMGRNTAVWAHLCRADQG